MSVLYLRAVGWTECFFVGCGWLAEVAEARWWFGGRRWSLFIRALHAISGHQVSSVQFASNSLQGFSELQLAGAGSCWASPLGALASSWVGGRSVRLEV